MNRLMRASALLVVLSVAGASQALTFNLNSVYTGATPGGTAPWATVTITDVAANIVNLRIDHNASSAAGQFISNLYLNLDPFIGSMTISNEVNSNKRDGAIGLSLNGINGAAGNQFDMVVPFETSNSGGGVNRLKPGEFWSADLTASGLSSSNFNSVNNKGNYVGAHVQGIAGGLSSHITQVPEPGTMAALGLGALAFLRRRRAK
ncbi:MAG: PEP-CTERM sorting domain-containing protein [Fimbriimonadaceae bacterium]|nr:PEP-CTERM sorting domain-containing protein [Fimbriimonadaceae bacterium]